LGAVKKQVNKPRRRTQMNHRQILIGGGGTSLPGQRAKWEAEQSRGGLVKKGGCAKWEKVGCKKGQVGREYSSRSIKIFVKADAKTASGGKRRNNHLPPPAA